MFGTDMVNVDMVFPLGGWLDQKGGGELSISTLSGRPMSSNAKGDISSGWAEAGCV